MPRRVAFLVALFVVCSFAVLAQSGGGTIQGTVNDSSGLAIPGAKVEIVHLATNRVTETVSNESGFFVTPPLTIGIYKIRVASDGMKVWETEANVETGRTLAITPVLRPGNVSETIEVVDTAPLVTQTEPTDGSTLDAQRIKEIPINGRNLNTLVELATPGVEFSGDVNGGVRISGLMAYSTDYVQDGASSNNREFGGSANLQGLESIGEVKVETSTSSARYTRPTSIIVSTKSGSNTLRFALFETNRNNAFGLARARQDVNLDGSPYKTPKLNRNEFGGSVGGPVVIPSFGLNGRKSLYNGKNRTFFFISQENVELRQGVTREFKVPTAAMRQGDFRELIDAQGRRLQLYDPATTRSEELASGRVVAVRDPFINNQIPLERMNALAKRIYAITPLPTDITNPVAANNLKLVVPTTAYPNLSDNPLTMRFDHRITDKDNFFVKYNGGNRSAFYMGTAGNNGAPTANWEANTTFLPIRGRAAALSWIRTLSASVFMETLVNRTWTFSRTLTGIEQKDWSAELGLPNPLGEIGWPNITNSGFMDYIEGDNRRQLYSMVTNVEQNYTYIRRMHNFQFGFRFHDEKQHLLPDQGAISGSVQFASNATALESPTLGNQLSPGIVPQTGHNAANFYLGVASQYTVGLKRGIMRVNEKNWGLYLQDNWKVSRRLTLMPGFRWDINPAFTEKNSLLSAFDVENKALVFPESLDYYYKLGVTNPRVVESFERVGVVFKSAADLGRPKQLFPSNLFDIGPRIGFAYNFSSDKRPLVIRGGYGLYISAVPMRTLLAQFSGLPPFRLDYTYSPNAANQSPDGIANYLLRTVPDRYAGVNSRDVIDVNDPATVSRGRGVIGMDGKQPSLKIHELNLALEKQLSRSTVARITYKAKLGVNADQLFNINPQPSDYIWYLTTGRVLPTGEYSGVLRRPYDRNAYTDVRILQRTGYLNSSTWSLEMERRFARGLSFQGFYTLTNSLRLAGNSFRDDVASATAAYLPGAVPTEFKELNRFLFYDRDTGIPKHRVRWNWIWDMPVGRKKAYLKGIPGWVDTLVGGWRMSGMGTVMSTWYSMPTDNWGEMGKFETYGTKYPILDCRKTPITASSAADERCVAGYLWHNGYISNRYINAVNDSGVRVGVFGLPDDYKPAQKPINPWPKNGKPTDLLNADYDTDFVYMPLITGGVVRVDYNTGLHPWRNQHRLGPFNWVMDASLMKFFNLSEKARLRANVDVFNVTNRQGLRTPSGEGIVSLGSSYDATGFRPRQLQLTLRLEF
ncbi:MAG: TonB-dependent receptor [Bryobacteraceae bacterium]|nr:TonB-dependent receptor [Bryobacteraceae bacterium]